jgi:hypothetical protein
LKSSSQNEEIQSLKMVLKEKELVIQNLTSQISSDIYQEENKLELSFRKFDNLINKDKTQKDEFQNFLLYSSRLQSEKKLNSLSKASSSNTKSNSNIAKKLFN